MPAHGSKKPIEDIEAIHQYYMQIINAIPDIVYWVDKECILKGCNRHFSNLLGLHTLKDFQGTPYQKMTQFARWNKERVEALKLDDMNALFSGSSLYTVEEKPVKTDTGKVF